MQRETSVVHILNLKCLIYSFIFVTLTCYNQIYKTGFAFNRF